MEGVGKDLLSEIKMALTGSNVILGAMCGGRDFGWFSRMCMSHGGTELEALSTAYALES